MSWLNVVCENYFGITLANKDIFQIRIAACWLKFYRCGNETLYDIVISYREYYIKITLHEMSARLHYMLSCFNKIYYYDIKT